MICERTADAGTDDGREPKDGAECAKESWAVLKTGNLRNDLYHVDDYLDPASATTITWEETRVRTHARGTHPADRSAFFETPHEGAGPGLEKCNGGHEDPLGRIDTHNFPIEQKEYCLSKDEWGGSRSLEGEGAKVLYSNVSVASIREDRWALTDLILGRAVARLPSFKTHSFIGADETRLNSLIKSN